MEKLLFDQGIFEHRSMAASIGGDEDSGENLSPDGVADIEAGILRCELPLISAEDFAGAVDDRMSRMRDVAQRQGIKCYVNVGGGAVSAGTSIGKRLFDAGLNIQPPLRMPADLDGVMPRFSRQGIPVINLVHVVDLAERYGLRHRPRQRSANSSSRATARCSRASTTTNRSPLAYWW